MKHTHLAAMIAVLMGVGAATAHTGATGVTLERMQGMSAMADAMKALGPIATGQAAFNQTIVDETARSLRLHSGDDMVALFQEGTDMAPSEAAPSVWSDPDGFAALSDQLATLADDLSAAQPADVTTVFAQIGRTCTACHQDYRIKRD